MHDESIQLPMNPAHGLWITTFGALLTVIALVTTAIRWGNSGDQANVPACGATHVAAASVASGAPQPNAQRADATDMAFSPDEVARADRAAAPHRRGHHGRAAHRRTTRRGG